MPRLSGIQLSLPSSTRLFARQLTANNRRTSNEIPTLVIFQFLVNQILASGPRDRREFVIIRG